MKNSLKLGTLVLLFFVAQSCTDLLQRAEPSTSTTQEIALGTEAGVKAVRASMYTNLFNFGNNTAYMIAPSSLADGLFISQGSNRFTGKNRNSTNETVDLWDDSYEIIQVANLLIGAIGEDVLSPDLLAQYQGEAYFMRAFAMHNLARSYSYEPGVNPNIGDGADFNLGIVIRTEPVLTPEDVTYKARATVQETYEQIEADLLTAIDLLSQGDAGIPRYATRAAAEALLARVYLYWQKWDLADQYATAALQHTSATLADPSEMGSLFLDPGTTIEVIFRGFIADPNNAVSEPVNNGKAAYTSKQWIAQVPTQDQMDLYSSNDARLAWFRPCLNELNGEPTPCRATHPAINTSTPDSLKQGLELAKWAGSLSDNLSDHIPYFRVPEMILIQAEARLKGTGGPAAAIAKLDELRASRGLTPYSGSVTPDAVMAEILDARRREFIGEGQRFWDLKRLGMDIRKAPETLALDPAVNVVPFSSFRILSRIPTGVVSLSQQNAEDPIVQNPGY